MRVVLAVAIVAAAGSAASAQTVFNAGFDNGYFTPFNANSPSSLRYADSGWLGFGPAVGLRDITLGFAVSASGPVAAGTTDLTFTFSDGDPSGLVFGSAATLYSTTLTNVQLPALEGGAPGFFYVTIPLPGVTTLGGFNNIGWSIGVQNYSYAGDFGFQCSSAFGQSVGFYTNNATTFSNGSWSQFSFGGDPVTGVANFVAQVTVPTPGAAAVLGLAGVAAFRRRRAR